MVLKALMILVFSLMTGGCTILSGSVQRHGQFALVRPDKVKKYKELHASVWPAVAEGMRKYHIRNYSIYMKELVAGQPALFGYFEYTGRDFDADMAKMLEDPKVQEWEALAGGECLLDLPGQPKDQWWVDMEEVFYFDGQIDKKVPLSKVQRFGSVIGVRPHLVHSYNLLHKHAWPEILAQIKGGNLRNYPIYQQKVGEKVYIFGYFEYVGNDFDKDMAKIDNDPDTLAWLEFTDKLCQDPISTRAEGEWWAGMEEVFHQQ